MKTARGPANDLIRDRYAPFRAEGGKRLPFERADYHTCSAPYDQAAIAQVGRMDEKQCFENLETLERTFLLGRQPPTDERIAILKRAARRIHDKAEAFADLIAWEGGKPLKDARIEVARAVSSLEWAAEEAGRLAGSEIPMRATKAASGRIAFTTPEPIGVVLAISAFNHPLNLIAHQVAPALAVGCPVLVKPALETPLSCLHLLEELYEAGLPPEMALPALCENQVAEKLVRSPKVAFMTFIGSAKVGWHLRSCLAPGARFSLEHGGSAPVLIDVSADLAEAVPLVLRGSFYHSGQVCVSTQRIYVHEAVRDEFTAQLLEAAQKLKVGDPRESATDCGPLIRLRDMDRIEAWVNEAVSHGAHLLAGGSRVGESCFAPTILRDVKRDERLVREEAFGPVVCLEGFRDLEEAIARANDVPWRFQAAVFTSELDRALKAVKGLRASAVMVNDSTAFRVDWMPFRGDGPSGFGTGGIVHSMRDMVNEKLVVIRSPHLL